MPLLSCQRLLIGRLLLLPEAPARYPVVSWRDAPQMAPPSRDISIFPHFWTIFIFWREIDEKQGKRRFTSGFFGGGNFFFFFYADAAREMASRVRKPLEASPVWIFFSSRLDLLLVVNHWTKWEFVCFFYFF